MNKLLKQLIMVLDENGIQVNKLNIVEKNKTGFYEIEVNEEMTIEDRGCSYALYTNEGKSSPTNYYSLTEALEVLSDYLSRVKEGTILKSGNGKYTYKVIKHQTHEEYNLLDLETNRLLFLEHASLSLIQAQVRKGVFYVEEGTPSTDIQVGDRVKVLESEGGAVGEATVTKVLNHGDVELAGKDRNGRYLTNWANHVSNLEKIEEEIKEACDYVEKVKEEDKPMGYTFWYIDITILSNYDTLRTSHSVLKTSPEGYFEDSTGRKYTYQYVSGWVKPIDREDVREEFEKAEHTGELLKYYSLGDMFVREH